MPWSRPLLWNARPIHPVRPPQFQRSLRISGLLAIVTGMLVGGSDRPAHAELHSAESIRVERNVEYAHPGETALHADIYRPPGEGPFPAVLVVHGGAWRTGSKAQLAGYAQILAQRGYVAMAINYRLAPDHRFPAQLEDCRSAVRWLRDNADRYNVDPERIGGIGYSAGGHLVALMAVTATSTGNGQHTADAKNDQTQTTLQAVVAGGTPFDFRETPLNATGLGFWLGGSRKEFPETYRAASPAAFVTPNAPPMFFFHGTEDRLVRPDSPQQMMERLEESGVEAELFLVENRGHLGAALDNEALRKSWEFLDKHLKPHADGAAPPSAKRERPAGEVSE